MPKTLFERMAEASGGVADEAERLRLTAIGVADSLSETQRECLLFWPRGHFTHGTIRALRAKKLLLGNQLTVLGDLAREHMRRKD